MFNFFKKIFSFFVKKSSYKTGITINPGETKSIILQGHFKNLDSVLPKNPTIGQRHKLDGFFIEYEDQDGNEYKQEFSSEIIFNGHQWEQVSDEEPIRINIGGECESSRA